MPTPRSQTEVCVLFPFTHLRFLLPPAPVCEAGVVRLLVELLQRQPLVDPLAVGGEGDVGGKVAGLGEVQVLHIQSCVLTSGEGKFTEPLFVVAANNESASVLPITLELE